MRSPRGARSHPGDRQDIVRQLIKGRSAPVATIVQSNIFHMLHEATPLNCLLIRNRYAALLFRPGITQDGILPLALKRSTAKVMSIVSFSFVN